MCAIVYACVYHVCKAACVSCICVYGYRLFLGVAVLTKKTIDTLWLTSSSENLDSEKEVFALANNGEKSHFVDSSP